MLKSRRTFFHSLNFALFLLILSSHFKGKISSCHVLKWIQTAEKHVSKNWVHFSSWQKNLKWVVVSRLHVLPRVVVHISFDIRNASKYETSCDKIFLHIFNRRHEMTSIFPLYRLSLKSVSLWSSTLCVCSLRKTSCWHEKFHPVDNFEHFFCFFHFIKQWLFHHIKRHQIIHDYSTFFVLPHLLMIFSTVCLQSLLLLYSCNSRLFLIIALQLCALLTYIHPF